MSDYPEFDDRAARRPARRGGSREEFDGDDYDDRGDRGGRRGSGGGRGGSHSVSAQAGDLRTRVLTGFLTGAVTALVLAFVCGMASKSGHAKSIAGVSLNAALIKYTVLCIPLALGVIAGVLKWRRITPLGLTWGYGVVAGLSWLALLFAAQVKNAIPHLPPLFTVPLITGAAFATGAALTDESTSATGRYACLAAVIAAHVGIVAIVATIVLA